MRNGGRKGGMVFDFTPLLDVILIIMFLVLIQGAIQVGNNNAARQELQNELEAEIQGLRSGFDAEYRELRDKFDAEIQALLDGRAAAEQDIRDSYELAVNDLYSRESNFRLIDEGRGDGGNIFVVRITTSDMTDKENAPVIRVIPDGAIAEEFSFIRISNPGGSAYENVKNRLKGILSKIAEDLVKSNLLASSDGKRAMFIIFDYVSELTGGIEFDLIEEAMFEVMTQQQENDLYVLVAKHRGVR